MDIELDIECNHCGQEFHESFRWMRHGRPLKCPYCAGFSLVVNGDFPVKSAPEVEAFERKEMERVFKRRMKF